MDEGSFPLLFRLERSHVALVTMGFNRCNFADSIGPNGSILRELTFAGAALNDWQWSLAGPE